jgi:heme A synthase
MNDSLKPGWKTTEFWSTVLAQVFALLALLGLVNAKEAVTLQDAANHVAEAMVLFGTNAAVVLYYIKTRFHLKGGTK